MCLENRAHGMRREHAIFHTPLAVDVQFEPLPVTDKYYERFQDDPQTWLVQTGEAKTENDYGVVGDRHGFEDSPDCEFIAGGLNTKEPYAVAIGRQANMLQWGFYAAPDRMTEGARRAFLNAIVYMRQFEGHVPLVGRELRSREWLQTFVDRIRRRHESGDRDSQQLGYLYGRFPPKVGLATGGDPKLLQKWLDKNLEYVIGGEKLTFGVDEDLQELRISNRSPKLLDWLHRKLKRNRRHAAALRIARRYLGEHGADAKTAVAWIEAHREHLFFSDVGGYRWFVDANAAGEQAPAKPASGGGSAKRR